MAEPDWNPDTAGRSLAEILREAGIEAPRSGRRQRRWDDPEGDVVPQRRASAPRSDGAGFGRRASDLRVAEDPPPVRRRVAPEPSTAAIPELRGPSRQPDVPGPSTPPVGARPRRPEDGLTGRSRPVDQQRSTGRQRPVDQQRSTGRQRPVDEQRSTGRQTRVPDRHRTPEPAVASTGRVSDRPVGRRPVDAHPVTGPIPVVTAGTVPDEEEAGPRESAMAWLRFAGELVIALAVGIGVYMLATVLWEQLPYVAVVLTPLAVTGLVAGVSMFRRRLGHESMGAPLLAVLVFAGVLLTVLPAVSVIPGG